MHSQTPVDHPKVQSQLERIGGVELGSFQLLGLLGEGAFASAYLAQQLGTDRQAVVKICHERLMHRADRGSIIVGFQNEVRASTRLQHPNMATIYTTGETHDGLPAIAMEFIPGDSLESFLERSAPLGHQQLIYFSQLASVLAAIHRLGVIHRDVSPKNILVTKDYDGASCAKLLDFGIAQFADTSSALRPLGTPRYAAPEQLRGQTVLASDLYGFGSILWWALTGERYLQGLESTEDILAYQLRHTEVEDPRQINPSISPGLAQLTRSLLDPAPQNRPSSAQLLARWPNIVAEARKWRRQTRPSLPAARPPVKRALRLLVIDPNPVKRLLVGGFTERLGCKVKMTDNPRDATRGLLGPFDVMIMPTELPNIDATAVAKHLKLHFPEQRLLLMSSHGERVLDCAEIGADIQITLPGELTRLAEYLETIRRRANNENHTPLDTLNAHEPVSSTILDTWFARPRIELKHAIEEFFGAMPSLVAQLELATPPEVVEICLQIEDRSSHLGALHLARLAKSFTMLVEAGEMPNPSGFIRELEDEYQRVFRQLLTIVQ